MSPTTKKKDGFTAEEKAAMRARAKEVKAAAQGEEAVQAALDLPVYYDGARSGFLRYDNRHRIVLFG